MDDILLDDDNDLLIENGDLTIGDSAIQDVALILATNKGEWKSAPLLGANLTELLRSRASQDEINKRIRLQMEYDGKDYDRIKELISYG